VDEHLRASEDVVAVGDVAAWWSTRYGRRLCVEHWENAVSGASVAAATLLRSDADGPPTVFDPVPYFWSDQFGHKLQYVGAHDDQSRVVFRTTSQGGWWSAAWLGADDRMTAMLVVDRPRDLVAARNLIEARMPVSPERLNDGNVALGEVVTA
jgi:3-phenylpropionate/trans-cinnamate dioxygenase ferredoxin reductase subunit